MKLICKNFIFILVYYRHSKTNNSVTSKIKFENQTASILWHLEGYLYDIMHTGASVPLNIAQIMPSAHQKHYIETTL